jgi:hypothetical protein
MMSAPHDVELELVVNQVDPFVGTPSQQERNERGETFWRNWNAK